jgi:hypothetical protein
VLIGDHLDLDVPAALDEALHEHDGIPEGALRLGPGAVERFLQFAFRTDDADPPPAAPAPCLDDERVPDRGRVPAGVLEALDRAAAPRRDGHAGLLGEHLRLDLGAQEPHRLR